MIARLEEMLEDSAWRYVTLQAWCDAHQSQLGLKRDGTGQRLVQY